MTIFDIDFYIKRKPRDSNGYFVRGEILRQQSEDTSQLELAVQHYQKALALNASFAEAYRELGLTLKTLRRPREAVDALNYYLSLKPNAMDKAIIKKYVDNLILN